LAIPDHIPVVPWGCRGSQSKILLYFSTKMNLFFKYSRRSLIRSHLDAQILDTDYFLRLIELTVIYSKYGKSILKIRIKKIF
jgi:hypothetical protein